MPPGLAGKIVRIMYTPAGHPHAIANRLESC
jgi:hypothetical protein